MAFFASGGQKPFGFWCQAKFYHPFLDGNGRIGRLLITLYLVNHNLLTKPTLYLSYFLEKHRTSYYDAFSRVRESNDLIQWIKFFLNAVITTSEKGKNTFITKRSTRDLFKEMIRIGILTEVTGFKRNRVFSFKEYLKLF